MLTADTITDEQIRELRSYPTTLDDVRPRGPEALTLIQRGHTFLCDDALDSPDLILRRRARAHCAAIINARVGR